MKTLLLIIAASATLMACEKETIVQGGKDDADNAAEVAATNVVLPPSIAATKTYRCADSSVVYIDWLSDNVTANFRPEENATRVQLKAPAAGEPLVAEGYSLTGDAKAAAISLTRPEKAKVSCKA